MKRARVKDRSSLRPFVRERLQYEKWPEALVNTGLRSNLRPSGVKPSFDLGHIVAMCRLLLGFWRPWLASALQVAHPLISGACRLRPVRC
jgi:hypothetical protein